ncbi:MAG: DEAD/DEAH box helicase [Acidobacteriota bacterium]|nr:DEAD/DEAH box helicase [Acidobacteriota bacterium]
MPTAVVEADPVAFDTLGLEPALLLGVQDRGFTATTPIQSAVYPIVVAGRDIIASAETGSGKTGAYLLPVLNRMLQRPGPAADATTRLTTVLVLAPTRELVVQIEDDLQGFIYHTALTRAAVFGGTPIGAQAQALSAGVDVVVATPGRLLDHLRGGIPAFAGVDTLILDEADRMLDMGFWPDVRRIVAVLPGGQKAEGTQRQTLLFSATIPNWVLTPLKELSNDPAYVQVGQRGAPADGISHAVECMPASRKTAWLTSFLAKRSGSVLVFVNTKRGTERLARTLSNAGLKAAALHADRSQSMRLEAIGGFRSGRYRVLVATDVAARGLDIEGISHVVNFEVPPSRDTYVHRVGRTARLDAKGIALTLAAPDELSAVKALQASIDLQLR